MRGPRDDQLGKAGGEVVQMACNEPGCGRLLDDNINDIGKLVHEYGDESIASTFFIRDTSNPHYSPT